MNKGYEIIPNLVEPKFGHEDPEWREVSLLQRIFKKTLSCLKHDYLLFLWDKTKNIFDVKVFPTLNEIFLIYMREELEQDWKYHGVHVFIERNSISEASEEKAFSLTVNIYDLQNCRYWCRQFSFEAHIHMLDTLAGLALFKFATSIELPGEIQNMTLPTSFLDITETICVQHQVEKYGWTYATLH